MRVVDVAAPEFNDLWVQLFQGEEFLYPFYQRYNIEYYKEYFSEHARFEDRSFVVEEQGRAILGVYMALQHNQDGSWEISGFGRPIFCVEDRTVDSAWRRTAQKHVRSVFDDLKAKFQLKRITYTDFAINGQLSFLSHHLLEAGGRMFPVVLRVINLMESEADLYRQVTKSNRNQIRWGEKNIEIRILDSATIAKNDMVAFQALHTHAAGRLTRSTETWDRQYEMVVHDEAFVVFGTLDNELVTAGLFSYSPDFCLYGVSASKRELFDKPLSHVVLWRAIMHAKHLGCQVFEMGELSYPNVGDPLPSPKELGISIFKRGFGGKNHFKLNIIWSL
jgi:hypothetical protein